MSRYMLLQQSFMTQPKILQSFYTFLNMSYSFNLFAKKCIFILRVLRFNAIFQLYR